MKRFDWLKTAVELTIDLAGECVKITWFTQWLESNLDVFEDLTIWPQINHFNQLFAINANFFSSTNSFQDVFGISLFDN